MLRSKLCGLLAGIVLLSPFTSHAIGVKPAFVFGYDLGGQGLKKATQGTDFNINAGAGFVFGGGIVLKVSDTDPHAFESQLTLNYKFDTDGNEDQGTVGWRQVTTDFISYYRNKRDKFRLGWGVTYQFDSELDGEKTKAAATTKFDDSLGYIFVAEFAPKNDSNMPASVAGGVRYTVISYEAENGIKVNGDSLGFYMTYIFNDFRKFFGTSR